MIMAFLIILVAVVAFVGALILVALDNKRMKKTILISLGLSVLVVVVGFFGLNKRSQYFLSDFEYVIENEKITIVDYTGSDENQRIPQKFESYEVIYIGDGAFEGSNSLIKTEIPDTVAIIGNRAFANCESLETVYISVPVTSIGESVFANCKSLTGVRIPDSVRHIGEDAFLGCDNLILTLTDGSYAHEYAIEENIAFVLE